MPQPAKQLIPWTPPNSPKQLNEIILSQVPVLLVEGPRFSSKTVGCLGAICWHLWTTPRARFVVLGRAQTDLLNAGPWQDLTENVIPQWEHPIDPNTGRIFNFGFKRVLAKGQFVRQEGITRRYFFEVTNQYGGKSRCYLESANIEDDADLEQKFKGKSYSGAYISELTNFKNPRIIDVIEETMRGLGLKPHQRRIIADTNPDYRLGKKSWVYRMFHFLKNLDLDNLSEEQEIELGMKGMVEPARSAQIGALKNRQSQIGVSRFKLEDNIFATKEEIDRQISRYIASGNPALLAAYVHGEWVESIEGDVIFSGAWTPDKVYGGSGANGGSVMLPEENCIELNQGWDLGGQNVGVVIIEKWAVTSPSGHIVPAFKIMSELSSLGRDQYVEEIVDEMLEQMKDMEDILARKVLWRCWSDRSSWVKKEAASINTEHIEVKKYSKGKIILQPISTKLKSAGMVEVSAQFLRRLLVEDRIFVSGKCTKTQEMFSKFRRNGRGKVPVVSEYKHVFDAIRYAISMECWYELVAPTVTKDGPREGQAPSGRIIATPC